MTSRENQQKLHTRAQSDNAAPVRTRKKGKNNNIPVHHDRIALPCEMSPPPGAPSSNQIKGTSPVPGRVARRLPLSPRTKIVRDCGETARQEQSPPPVDPGTNKIAGQRQSPSPPFHWGRCIPPRAPWRVALGFRCVGISRTQRLGLTAIRGWASGPFPPRINSFRRARSGRCSRGTIATKPSRYRWRRALSAAMRAIARRNAEPFHQSIVVFLK